MMSFNNFEFSLPVLSGIFKKDHKLTDLDYVYVGSTIKPVMISSVSHSGYCEKTWLIVNAGKRFKVKTIKNPNKEYYHYSWKSEAYNGQ